jgi:hypothetical protein
MPAEAIAGSAAEPLAATAFAGRLLFEEDGFYLGNGRRCPKNKTGADQPAWGRPAPEIAP